MYNIKVLSFSNYYYFSISSITSKREKIRQYATRFTYFSRTTDFAFSFVCEMGFGIERLLRR